MVYIGIGRVSNYNPNGSTTTVASFDDNNYAEGSAEDVKLMLENLFKNDPRINTTFLKTEFEQPIHVGKLDEELVISRSFGGEAPTI